MKNLILFSTVGLLFFTGCQVNSSRVICMDVKHRYITHDVVTTGKVFAFVVKGIPMLSYINAETNEQVFINLNKNDCGVY